MNVKELKKACSELLFKHTTAAMPSCERMTLKEFFTEKVLGMRFNYRKYRAEFFVSANTCGPLKEGEYSLMLCWSHLPNLDKELKQLPRYCENLSCGDLMKLCQKLVEYVFENIADPISSRTFEGVPFRKIVEEAADTYMCSYMNVDVTGEDRQQMIDKVCDAIDTFNMPIDTPKSELFEKLKEFFEGTEGYDNAYDAFDRYINEDYEGCEYQDKLANAIFCDDLGHVTEEEAKPIYRAMLELITKEYPHLICIQGTKNVFILDKMELGNVICSK